MSYHSHVAKKPMYSEQAERVMIMGNAGKIGKIHRWTEEIAYFNGRMGLVDPPPKNRMKIRQLILSLVFGNPISPTITSFHRPAHL